MIYHPGYIIQRYTIQDISCNDISSIRINISEQINSFHYQVFLSWLLLLCNLAIIDRTPQLNSTRFDPTLSLSFSFEKSKEKNNAFSPFLIIIKNFKAQAFKKTPLIKRLYAQKWLIRDVAKPSTPGVFNEITLHFFFAELLHSMIKVTFKYL